MKTIKLYLLVISGMLIFINCNRDEGNDTEFESNSVILGIDEDVNELDYESIGIILGLDEVVCACCGNWKIDIVGSQNTRQFLTLPQESQIDLENAMFPLTVNLNWSESNLSSCNYIIIEEIEIN